MTCTFCGSRSRLSKDEADRLAHGPGGAVPQPQGWPQGAHQPGQPQQEWPPPDQYRQQG